MPFQAKVFKILIASPSDVGERKLISEVIQSWNFINSETRQVVLLPVMWETHAAPELGADPQSIINDRLVKDCDLLIGAFWTRLGSPTGRASSGTVEEIEQFIRDHKPVMLFFSKKPIDPTSIDVDQHIALKDFKQKIKSLGLYSEYSSEAGFRESLLQALSIRMNELLSSSHRPIVRTPDLDRIQRETLSNKHVYLENYKKAVLVKGETRPLKDVLRDKGGKWNRQLGAWVFKSEMRDELQALIDGKAG